MNLLINGPSPARGPNTWPYLLQSRYNANLVNLAQAGAGNIYIADATIAELTQRKYDLVVIMWADMRRFDIKVADVDQFSDTIYTAKYQKIMNDWPEKIVRPVNDQDYVDDNWVFGCGYLNTKDASVVKLFGPYYEHTNLDAQYFTSYCKFLALQGFLKSINQPYLFVSTRRFSRISRFQNLYNALDFGLIVDEKTIFDFAKESNSWDDNGLHPGLEAHRLYADYLLEHLVDKKILP